jgi:hypothetical protein
MQITPLNTDHIPKKIENPFESFIFFLFLNPEIVAANGKVLRYLIASYPAFIAKQPMINNITENHTTSLLLGPL